MPELVLHATPPSHPCMTAEAALRLKGVTLRAHERASDVSQALNLLADDLARQVKKHRDKRRDRRSSSRVQGHAASP
jgi:putative sigma-54 modulation protein